MQITGRTVGETALVERRGPEVAVGAGSIEEEVRRDGGVVGTGIPGQQRVHDG